MRQLPEKKDVSNKLSPKIAKIDESSSIQPLQPAAAFAPSRLAPPARNQNAHNLTQIVHSFQQPSGEDYNRSTRERNRIPSIRAGAHIVQHSKIRTHRTPRQILQNVKLGSGRQDNSLWREKRETRETKHNAHQAGAFPSSLQKWCATLL